MLKSICTRGAWLLLCLLLSAPSLFAQATGKDWKAAEVFTKQSYRYGKIQIRMRMAKGDGVLSNFFTYRNGSERSDTFWEEIDIEVFGKNNATTWQSNILQGQGNSPAQDKQQHQYCRSLGDGYHTYTLEWSPNKVVWRLDGRFIRQRTNGSSRNVNDAASLRLNIWSAFQDQFPEVGPFDPNSAPTQMFVNWIKFYEYSNGRFASSPTWRDDFNGSSLNSDRWGRANWTFGANRADFDPRNVVVKNGKLILAFTRAGQEGYNGTPPADSPTQGCSDVNSIYNFNAPGTIRRNTNFNVNMYVSSKDNNRDIVVQLQEDSAPYTVYREWRYAIGRSWQRRSYNLNAGSSFPTGENRLQLQAMLVPRGGGYNNRLARRARNNINGRFRSSGFTTGDSGDGNNDDHSTLDPTAIFLEHVDPGHIFHEGVFTDLAETDRITTRVFPNPATSGQATLEFTLPSAANVDITVSDLNGRVLGDTNIDAASGTQRISLDRTLGAPLKAGIYLVRVSADQQVITRRLVVR